MSENKTSVFYTDQKQKYQDMYDQVGRPVGYSVADMNAFLLPRKTSSDNFQLLDERQSILAGPTKFSTLTMLTVSTHRDKFPVSSLSKIDPTGFTAGHRTIAGSITFSTFDRAVFAGILTSEKGYKNVHSDEIPLFDMMVILADDTGNSSTLKLYGITMLDGSMVLSLDNISPNETYSYMALKLDPLNRSESNYNTTVYNKDQGVDTDILSNAPMDSSTAIDPDRITVPPTADERATYINRGTNTRPFSMDYVPSANSANYVAPPDLSVPLVATEEEFLSSVQDIVRVGSTNPDKTAFSMDNVRELARATALRDRRRGSGRSYEHLMNIAKKELRSLGIIR